MVAACLRDRLGLSAFCVKRRRWADLDLNWQVGRGYGGLELAAF
jgi:hypothetical protein